MKSILRNLIVWLIIALVVLILVIYSVIKVSEIGAFIGIILLFVVGIAVFNNIKNMLIIISNGNL